MIESVLSLLIFRIASLAVNHIIQTDDEFSKIEGKLKLMRKHLEYAEKMGARTKAMDRWVENVRVAAYKVEDLMDEFLDQIQSHNGGGVNGYGQRILYYPVDKMRIHNIVTEVQKVSDRIDEIFEARNRFVSPEPDHEESELTRRLPGFDGGEAVLGIEGSKGQIVQWLISPEQHRKVVSVCGMGGLGKTTLVGAVYKHPAVTNSFTVRAWVSVTNFCSIDDLLRNMMHDIRGGAKMDQVVEAQTGAMVSKLSELLAPEKYLIILDDVWDVNVYNDLFKCFPTNNKGSRIIVTTRIHQVATFVSDYGYVLNIDPLSEKDASSLFHRAAFGNSTCHRELHQWARKIINKCGGLPLAIITIGRVMAGKPATNNAWESMCQRLDWELSNNEIFEGMMRGLMLSYKSLPYHLQRCFLYCSLFKEGHPIKTKWLVRMWIAEGFVLRDANDRMTVEEIGVSYVDQLAATSTLQVVKKDAAGLPKVCQVHDIMRELALKASQGQNLCATTADQLAYLDERCRRLSVIKDLDDRVRLSNYLPQIRTLLIFAGESSTNSSLQRICKSLKFLRVLDLRDAPVHILPSNVFDLFNLRYLSLRGTNVKEISSDLKKLYNLQTLDLWKTKVRQLPREVLKLQHLRHLYKEKILAEKLHYLNIGGLLRGPDAPSTIADLSDLQTLKTIKASQQTLVQIGGLTQLRHLGVTNLDAILGATLCHSINRMEKLSHLSINATSINATSINTTYKQQLMLSELSPPADLHKLILNGRLNRVPFWFSSLNSLTHLYLFNSWLTEMESPIPPLRYLPNLVLVALDDDAYQGGPLHFEAATFRRLGTLILSNLRGLSRLSVENGSLPNLQVMYLRKLTNLRAVEGTQYITRMQDLHLRGVPIDAASLRLNPGVRLFIS